MPNTKVTYPKTPLREMMGLPLDAPLRPEVTIMPQKIMDVLMLGRCSHEFSWPRRAADGDYYQVCLLCAAEYKYDWTTMRRIERVEHAKPETGIRRSHTREKRPSWVPRARRLKLDLALRYRVNNTSTWYEGTINNISQTGVLFSGPQQLPVNALIEMVFEMPEEISGRKNSNVLCQGRMIRAKDAEDSDVGQAASIVDYKFIH
jgi:PilZ domain